AYPCLLLCDQLPVRPVRAPLVGPAPRLGERGVVQDLPAGLRALPVRRRVRARQRRGVGGAHAAAAVPHPGDGGARRLFRRASRWGALHHPRVARRPAMTDGLELLKKVAAGRWRLVVWVVWGIVAIVVAFARVAECVAL